VAHDSIHVLFLCPHNAARSLMAEAVTRHLGKGRFTASSAGWAPAPQPHHLALESLRHAAIPTEGLYSKSWWDLAAPHGPQLDVVITLSDDLPPGGRPLWCGLPATAAWDFPDPLAATGTETAQHEAFRQVLHGIRKRVELMINLPHESLERLKFQDDLRSLAEA
jgi:protein-tyrosine-phosphatase